MAYEDDGENGHSYGAGNNQLLIQLANDVRAIRRTMESQGRDISDLREKVAGLDVKVAGLRSLTPEGRAEAYVKPSEIRQSIWLALGFVGLIVLALAAAQVLARMA